MDVSDHTPDEPRVLMAFDGSLSAHNAIQVGAQLLPTARVRVVYLWGPPFASFELRHRLWPRARSVSDMIAMVEREGLAEAERLVAAGVTLAGAVGWRAEALVERCNASEGFELARLAEDLAPAAVVIGSRGLSGRRVALGSVSDAIVHYSPSPVLVIPPLLLQERRAADAGPVVVAHDGSSGSRRALAEAASLFRDRRIIVVRAGSRAPDRADLEAAGAPEAEAVAVPADDSATGRAVADALAGFAAQQEAALIVIGSRGRSALKEIVLGSVAMATLHHGHRAVLVVPETKHAED